MWVPRVCCVSSGAAAPTPLLTALPGGTPVVRNPAHWHFGDCDGNGARGRVKASAAGTVTVEWPGGRTHEHSYEASKGFDIVAAPTPGDTVVRNPRFWAFMAADGNGPGIVMAVDGEHVTVKWRAGGTGDYTFDGKCQHVQTTKFGEPEPIVAAPTSDPSFPIRPLADADFHLIDKLISIDIANQGKAAKCRESRPGTVCSAEVFQADAQFSVNMLVLEHCGGHIGVGVVARDDTRTASKLLVGQADLPGSVGFVLAEGKVQMLHNGALVATKAINTGGVTILTMTLAHGKLSFLADGDAVGEVALPRAADGYRLGASLGKKGQLCALMTIAELRARMDKGKAATGRGIDSRAVSVPFDGEFTFHDRFTSMDATDGGKLATCVRNHEATCYTREVFDATATVVATLAVGNLGGEPVTFGLMSSNATKECAAGALGAMDGTIGCRVRSGHVELHVRGKLVFSGSCGDTSGETRISLKLENGYPQFSVGGKDLSRCSALEGLNLSGKLRLGATLCKTGQTGKFVNSDEPDAADMLAAILLALQASRDRDGGARDRNVFPKKALHGNDFHLVDSLQSVDVANEGKAAQCKTTRNATVCSAEVFARNADFTVNLTVLELKDKHIGFGVLCRDDTSVASRYLVGEKEIPGSVGLLVSPGKVTVYYKDKAAKTMKLDTDGVTVLTMRIAQGKIAFFADGDAMGGVDMADMQGGNAANGYRLGVSLSKEGQLCALMGIDDLIAAIGGGTAVADLNESRRDLLADGTGFAVHEWLQMNNIGAGAFGEVFKIRHKVTGALAARKDVNLGKVQLSDAEREVAHMMALAHRNVVKVFASMESKHSRVLHIYMELCDGGTLSGKLKSHTLTPEDVLAIARDIVQGLVFIHSRKTIHRDVKPDNILLCKGDGNNGGAKFVAKHGDLGLAKDIGRATHANTQAGTPLYMAPEIFFGKGYTCKVDVWAAGCVLYELVTGRATFGHVASTADLVIAVTTANYPAIPSAAASAHRIVAAAAVKMLQADPAKRPTSADAAKFLR
jgi:hypothetical protein